MVCWQIQRDELSDKIIKNYLLFEYVFNHKVTLAKVKDFIDFGHFVMSKIVL